VALRKPSTASHDMKPLAGAYAHRYRLVPKSYCSFDLLVVVTIYQPCHVDDFSLLFYLTQSSFAALDGSNRGSDGLAENS